MKILKNIGIKNTIALCAGSALSLGLALPAHANLLAYEGFNYNTQGSGTPLTNYAPTHGIGDGFTGNWNTTNGTTSEVVWSNSSLGYTDRKSNVLATTGGSAIVNANNLNQNAFLRLNFSPATIGAMTSGGTDAQHFTGKVYFSFLIQRTGPKQSDPETYLGSEYPRNFGFRIMNNATANNNNGIATIGQGSFNAAPRNHLDEWSLASFQDVAYDPSGVSFSDNEIAFIVGEVDFDFDTLKLWINPDLDTVNVRDGFISAAYTNGGVQQNMAFYAFGLEAGGGPNGDGRLQAQFNFDEFRLGTTFEAVGVPEPSTYALILGALACGFIAYRRRKVS